MIPVYSISKPFLAQAVLEIGFSVDDAIGLHLPNLGPSYASRTIGKLLNHTSGLGSYGELSEYIPAVERGDNAWSRENLLARCETLEHKKNGFFYSNIGYLLLRMLVENETGLSYFDSLQHLVFEPLGITCFIEWETPNDVVPGYDPKWVYSGTFLANPDEISLAVSVLAQYRERMLGLNAGLIPVVVQDSGFDSPGYNYGFMTDGGSENLKPRFVGHGGSGPSYDLMVLVNTDTWSASLEWGTSDFIQSDATQRLKSLITRS